MAQQLINIGEDNAGLGDELPTCFEKTNENFTELFSNMQQGTNEVFLYSEADLPTKTAATWTMNENTPYVLAASFTSTLQCIAATGSSLRCHSLTSFTYTYDGPASPAFLCADVSFYIHDINIDAGGWTAFDASDSVGSVYRFIAKEVVVTNAFEWAVFTNLRLAQVINCNGEDCSKGIRFVGNSGLVWSVNAFGISSTSATFKAIDFGSASSPIAEFDDVIVTAPAGAYGFSGLAGSGNIPTGRLGRINGCEFIGGVTDLQGLTIDDIRWVFRDNTPTQDTMADALISTQSSLTTSPPAAGVFIKANATWATARSSQYLADSTGRITWLGERAAVVPVDMSLSLEPSSGTNKSLYTRLAVNGVTIAASERRTRTDAGDASSVTTPWQLELQPGDYVEAFVMRSDAGDLIVSSGILRVK